MPEPRRTITVGSYEAKTHLPRLLDQVAKGERVVITKHGRAVAMLVPPEDAPGLDAVTAVARLMAFPRQSLEAVTVRELIDEGRRR